MAGEGQRTDQFSFLGFKSLDFRQKPWNILVGRCDEILIIIRRATQVEVLTSGHDET